MQGNLPVSTFLEYKEVFRGYTCCEAKNSMRQNIDPSSVNSETNISLSSPRIFIREL
jgi:hypothetical protein